MTHIQGASALIQDDFSSMAEALAARRMDGVTEVEHRAGLREAGITQAEYRASFYWDDEPLSDDAPQHDVSW